MAKFKRYFTGSDNRKNKATPGKGHDRREAQVAEQTVARNWCRTFGHKSVAFDTEVCRDCGTTLEEIAENREAVILRGLNISRHAYGVVGTIGVDSI